MNNTYKVLNVIESEDGSNKYSLCTDNVLENISAHSEYYKIKYKEYKKIN